MSEAKAIRKHVLVVEDERHFAALLRSILTTAGYTVATAYNCEDALAEARKHRPDVITLDIGMRRKSGVFFYRKLKAEAAFRGVPIVVVTGLTRDKEMENLIRSLLEPDSVPPPEAYLEKPIDPPRFLGTIQAAIDKFACAAHN